MSSCVLLVVPTYHILILSASNILLEAFGPLSPTINVSDLAPP